MVLLNFTKDKKTGSSNNIISKEKNKINKDELTRLINNKKYE